MNRYQPDMGHYYQLQHSPCGSTNCVFECAAWLLDAMTFGKVKINGGNLKEHEGGPCGGTDAQHLDDLLARWYPPDRLATGWFPIPYIKDAILKEGKAFSAAILYSVIADAGFPFSGQEHGFRGWHEVIYTADDHGAILRGDPLRDGRRPTIGKGYSADPMALIDKTFAVAAAAGGNPGKVHGSLSMPLWLPTTPVPPAVLYKYGAVARRRGTVEAIMPVDLRHNPAIDKHAPKANSVRTLPAGGRFYVAQSLQKKNGNIWGGNATGDLWVLMSQPRIRRV